MTHAEQIVANEIKKARREFGGGWAHFSVEIRQAIVSERIFAIACGQDESINPARVVAVMREMRSAVIEQMENER